MTLGGRPVRSYTDSEGSRALNPQYLSPSSIGRQPDTWNTHTHAGSRCSPQVSWSAQLPALRAPHLLWEAVPSRALWLPTPGLGSPRRLAACQLAQAWLGMTCCHSKHMQVTDTRGLNTQSVFLHNTHSPGTLMAEPVLAVCWPAQRPQSAKTKRTGDGLDMQDWDAASMVSTRLKAGVATTFQSGLTGGTLPAHWSYAVGARAVGYNVSGC